MEKKKVGRPKKVVATKPKIKVNYKEAYIQAVEVIEGLNQQIDKAVQKRGFWIQKTEETQKKNEALFSLVKELVDTAVNDLVQVEVTTGKITALDAIYHVSMIERVMESKFNSETEE
jgi:CRISPR/Cas system CSM-associated protein Csm2 small subunit